MKGSFVVLLALFFTAQVSFAAYYQWTDDKGVVHFTDNRDKIPGKYQKKAKKLKLTEEPAATSGTPPMQVVPMGPSGQQGNPQQAPPQQGSPQQPPPQPAAQPSTQAGPGGQSEQWWRQRFADLRSELKRVQDSLSANRVKLAQAQRRRAIYVRIQDREAVNAAQALVAADEAKETDVFNRIDALSREAASAGVPPEWRQ